MKERNFWEILFDNNKYPCFLLDKTTLELKYYNKEFRILFDIQEDIIGRVFHQVITPDEYMLEEELPDWDKRDVFFSEAYNQRLNKRFHVRVKYLELYNVLFCELISTDNDLEANSEFEVAMSNCMEIFNRPHNKALISFMELLCQYYDSERAYVYRINYETNTINCVTQWCLDSKFRVTEEITTKMDSRFIIDWISNDNKTGIVSADMTSESFDHTSSLAKLMFNLNIQNMTLCTVEDTEHNLMGVVGLSNRKDTNKYFDPRLIHAISKFVAQDVNKEVIDATVFHVHNRDTLTGFYNRSAYTKKIEKLTEKLPHSLGVVSGNVNGLRHINDNFGIAQGDKIIKKVAQQLTDHFGFEFFRLSGDEFIGFASDIEEKTLVDLVETLHQKKKEEGNHDYSFGHAFGVGRYDIFKLIQEADTLMYINKQEYYATCQRSYDSVNDSTLSDLLSYLANEEFMIYLQPQVRLQDGSLHGAEALIRRFDKTNQKMVFPDQFIALYEQKSVIRHVDMFVVEEVCKLLKVWQVLGRAIPISVNLSRVTLQEFGIVDSIVEICDKYQIAHKLLVIEVTERVGLIENNVASTLILDFKKHGFSISLDDFGCAYSNIVTLAQIDVDEVKLDKSLVDEILINKKNNVIVESVLAMCNKLENTSTLAEGIEEEAQAKMLHHLTCVLGQGYYYSRPIPVGEFAEKYIAV